MEINFDERIVLAMCRVLESGKDPDRVLVAEDLMKQGQLQDIGGVSLKIPGRTISRWPRNISSVVLIAPS